MLARAPFGGAAFSRILVLSSRPGKASLDLENAFSYCRIPQWMVVYQAVPAIQLRYAPKAVRRQFRGWPRHTLVHPCYNRLAMGSTHAADMLPGVTVFRYVARMGLRSELSWGRGHMAAVEWI